MYCCGLLALPESFGRGAGVVLVFFFSVFCSSQTDPYIRQRYNRFYAS